MKTEGFTHLKQTSPVLRAITYFMKNISYLLLFSLFTVFGQENIPIGSWRFHPSTTNGQSIASSSSAVYTVVNDGLLLMDISNNTITSNTVLTSQNALSEIKPSAVAVSTTGNVIIGFENGAINFLQDNEIEAVNSFRDFSSTFINGSKKINDISFRGTDTALFATGIGFLEYDLVNNVFGESFVFTNRIIGEPGFDILSVAHRKTKGEYYCITGSTIYWEGDTLGDSVDPRLISNWNDSLLPVSSSLTSLVVFNDTVYVGTDGDGVLAGVSSGSSFIWNTLPGTENKKIISLETITDSLFILTDSSVLHATGTDTAKTQLTNTLLGTSSDIAVREDGSLWMASTSDKAVLSNYQGALNSVGLPNGVSSANFASIDLVNGSIVALPGNNGPSSQYDIFEGGVWRTVTQDSAVNFKKVVYAPFDGQYYFATNEGLYSASELDEAATHVASLGTSEITDLLITNSGSVLILADKREVSEIGLTGFYSYLNLDTDSKKIVQDNSGNYWFVRVDGKLQIWSPNFTSSNLLGLNVVIHVKDEKDFTNDIALDLEGQLWVGSSNGIGYFPNPSLDSKVSNVPNNNSTDVVRPFSNGFPKLRSVSVGQILVDGGNRKWVITKDDQTYLRLLSDDGKNDITSFTLSNAPPTSSTINDIELNSSTGELFVATDEGLFSYRTGASSSSGVHENVKVFPNPIPPNYDGNIGISGLATDATVKITDISGNLLFEVDAEGGTATWNGKNYQGNRPQTGVYLIFSSTDDGEETFVGKLAIVR
ncbi:MAG: hypothetical protein AB8B61_03785 [Cyclobacteriaceae bacterium]